MSCLLIYFVFVEFLSSFDANMNSLSQLLIISAKLEKHNEEESS